MTKDTNEAPMVYIQDNGDKEFLTAVDSTPPPLTPLERAEQELASITSVYIAGPMTGYKNNNYPLFNEVATYLNRLPIKIYNPADGPNSIWNEHGDHEQKEFSLSTWFPEYVRIILNEIDTILLLPGFEESKGATSELLVTEMHNSQVTNPNKLIRVLTLKELFKLEDAVTYEKRSLLIPEVKEEKEDDRGY